MSYTPNTWQTGDTITAAKLNKLEQGVAAGSLVVNITYDDQNKAVLDKTWQEIYDAAHAGSPIVAKEDYAADGIFYYLLTDVYQSGSTYLITLHNPADITKSMVLQTDLASGYPHS